MSQTGIIPDAEDPLALLAALAETLAIVRPVFGSVPEEDRLRLCLPAMEVIPALVNTLAAAANQILAQRNP